MNVLVCRDAHESYRGGDNHYDAAVTSADENFVGTTEHGCDVNGHDGACADNTDCESVSTFVLEDDFVEDGLRDADDDADCFTLDNTFAGDITWTHVTRDDPSQSQLGSVELPSPQQQQQQRCRADGVANTLAATSVEVKTASSQREGGAVEGIALGARARLPHHTSCADVMYAQTPPALRVLRDPSQLDDSSRNSAEYAGVAYLGSQRSQASDYGVAYRVANCRGVGLSPSTSHVCSNEESPKRCDDANVGCSSGRESESSDKCQACCVVMLFDEDELRSQLVIRERKARRRLCRLLAKQFRNKRYNDTSLYRAGDRSHVLCGIPRLHCSSSKHCMDYIENVSTTRGHADCDACRRVCDTCPAQALVVDWPHTDMHVSASSSSAPSSHSQSSSLLTECEQRVAYTASIHQPAAPKQTSTVLNDRSHDQALSKVQQRCAFTCTRVALPHELSTLRHIASPRQRVVVYVADALAHARARRLQRYLRCRSNCIADTIDGKDEDVTMEMKSSCHDVAPRSKREMRSSMNHSDLICPSSEDSKSEDTYACTNNDKSSNSADDDACRNNDVIRLHVCTNTDSMELRRGSVFSHKKCDSRATFVKETGTSSTGSEYDETYDRAIFSHSSAGGEHGAYTHATSRELGNTVLSSSLVGVPSSENPSTTRRLDFLTDECSRVDAKKGCNNTASAMHDVKTSIGGADRQRHVDVKACVLNSLPIVDVYDCISSDRGSTCSLHDDEGCRLDVQMQYERFFSSFDKYAQDAP